MKKIFIVFLFVFLGFLFQNNSVFASCVNPQSGQCPQNNPIYCSGETVMCCQNPAECQAATSKPTPTPTPRVSVGCYAKPSIGCAGTTDCGTIGKNPSFCCASNAECPALPPTPTPGLASGCVNKIANSCPQGLTDCKGGDASAPCCANGMNCPKGIPGVTLPTPSPKAVNPCGNAAIPTALGCIGVTDTSALTASILKLGIGIGGGIAFILMLAAVFMIMTSAGDPKRMQAGQELITSALMGLLLIIFSVFLLQFIGVKILDIPGFSK